MTTSNNMSNQYNTASPADTVDTGWRAPGWGEPAADPHGRFGRRRPRRLYERLGELVVTADRQAADDERRAIEDHALRGYRRDVALASRDEILTHARDGWWIGRAPYGYQRHAHRIPDPKRPGRRLRRYQLKVDRHRASVVGQIFTWYVHHGLGTSAIATRLVADPDTYPPPSHRNEGRGWAAATVRTVLDEPAYLGYVVRGRTRDGQPLSPGRWLWSLVGYGDWWAAHFRLHPRRARLCNEEVA